MNKEQQVYSDNSDNFSRELRRLIREDENPFDETTSVKIFYNDNGGVPYIRFEINGKSCHMSTSYYPSDFDRSKEHNLDELDGNAKDKLIFELLGSEIPKEILQDEDGFIGLRKKIKIFFGS